MAIGGYSRSGTECCKCFSHLSIRRWHFISLRKTRCTWCINWEKEQNDFENSIHEKQQQYNGSSRTPILSKWNTKEINNNDTRKLTEINNINRKGRTVLGRIAIDRETMLGLSNLENLAVRDEQKKLEKVKDNTGGIQSLKNSCRSNSNIDSDWGLADYTGIREPVKIGDGQVSLHDKSWKT